MNLAWIMTKLTDLSTSNLAPAPKFYLNSSPKVTLLNGNLCQVTFLLRILEWLFISFEMNPKALAEVYKAL